MADLYLSEGKSTYNLLGKLGQVPIAQKFYAGNYGQNLAVNRNMYFADPWLCTKEAPEWIIFMHQTCCFTLKRCLDGQVWNLFEIFYFFNSIKVRHVDHHDEVELLLEGYRADFLQIQLEVGTIKGQIDDAKEFINTHQARKKWKKKEAVNGPFKNTPQAPILHYYCFPITAWVIKTLKDLNDLMKYWVGASRNLISLLAPCKNSKRFNANG